MKCLLCNGGHFTIAGFCKTCRPGLHKAYEDMTAALTSMEARYHILTGKTAMDDWFAYEKFIETQDDYSKVVMTTMYINMAKKDSIALLRQREDKTRDS